MPRTHPLGPLRRHLNRPHGGRKIRLLWLESQLCFLHSTADPHPEAEGPRPVSRGLGSALSLAAAGWRVRWAALARPRSLPATGTTPRCVPVTEMDREEMTYHHAYFANGHLLDRVPFPVSILCLMPDSSQARAGDGTVPTGALRELHVPAQPRMLGSKHDFQGVMGSRFF